MKKKVSCLAGIAAMLSVAAAFAGPPVVDPEGPNLDVDLSAKIGKEKSKAKKMSVQNGSGDSGGSSNCGSVNINSNESKSNSGIKGMLGKQTTTIVTGPVINMASCK